MGTGDPVDASCRCHPAMVTLLPPDGMMHGADTEDAICLIQTRKRVHRITVGGNKRRADELYDQV